MASKHGNCHQNSLWGVGLILYCITFLLELDSCWRLATKCVSYFTILDLLWTEFWQRAAFFAVRIFLATISVFVVLPNYSRQNQWSRRALLFLRDVFKCWDVECFYMLVARCVHRFMKSDLRQLSLPLLWPFLTCLRRIAHKTTIEP